MGLYEIAGLTVEMEITGRTLIQAEPYRCKHPKKADIQIHCDPDQIMQHNPQMKDPDMAQYLGSGAIFARELLRYQGFQLHASSVSLEDRAYLFTAPGGVGKSTHTEKWCRLFGARYINDDKPVLRVMQDGWTVWGTPWSGKHDLSDPQGVRLGAIAYLQRGEENRIERLQADRSVPLVLSQCLRKLSAQQMDLQLELLDKLLQEVPVFLLSCRNEDAAAFLSRKIMTEAAL